MVTSDKLATDSTMSKSRSTTGNACGRNLQVSTKIAGTLQDQNKANLTSDWTALIRQMFMDNIFSHFICGPALANHLLVLVSQENFVQVVQEKCVSAIHTAPELHFLAGHARPPDHSKTMLHSCSVSSYNVDLGAAFADFACKLLFHNSWGRKSPSVLEQLSQASMPVAELYYHQV